QLGISRRTLHRKLAELDVGRSAKA
ncbi:hypothetical protein EBX31_01995, partial [bacterium]|nr:hypothetical protein [bacterium]